MHHTSFCGKPDMRDDPLHVCTKGLISSSEYATWYIENGKPFIYNGQYMVVPQHAQSQGSQWQGKETQLRRNQVPPSENTQSDSILDPKPQYSHPDCTHTLPIPNNNHRLSRKYLAWTLTPSLNIRHTLDYTHTTRSLNGKHLPLRISSAQHLRYRNTPSSPMMGHAIIPVSLVHLQDHWRLV